MAAQPAAAGSRTISKFARQNGLANPYPAACSGSSTGVNSVIEIRFTAKTVSDSMACCPPRRYAW